MNSLRTRKSKSHDWNIYISTCARCAISNRQCIANVFFFMYENDEYHLLLFLFYEVFKHTDDFQFKMLIYSIWSEKGKQEIVLTTICAIYGIYAKKNFLFSLLPTVLLKKLMLLLLVESREYYPMVSIIVFDIMAGLFYSD